MLAGPAIHVRGCGVTAWSDREPQQHRSGLCLTRIHRSPNRIRRTDAARMRFAANRRYEALRSFRRWRQSSNEWMPDKGWGPDRYAEWREFLACLWAEIQQ